MLLDTRKENQTPEGFNPNVQNQEIVAKATGGQKTAWIIIFCILLGIITLWICPIVINFKKKNWFNKTQMSANEAASSIDVQLAQRRDTLVKLVDATRTSMKFEKELLTEVTEMRSLKIDAQNAVKAGNQIEQNFGRFIATLENYPEVKSMKLVQELMEAADYQERELAAARRLYNSIASGFNEEIFTWPGIIMAEGLQLHTLPLFIASATQKQDVSLNLN